MTVALAEREGRRGQRQSGKESMHGNASQAKARRAKEVRAATMTRGPQSSDRERVAARRRRGLLT